MNINIQKITDTLYIIGIAGLLIALPLSNFFMSVFQFFILGAWILGFGFLKKSKIFFSNKYALIIVSLFLLHIIGLIWTSDINYALNDIRIKLPLLMMPVVLSTGPKINKKTFENLLLVFIASVIIATFICTKIYIYDEYKDIRDISLFISHIRFALLICFSIFILFYFLLNNNRFNIFFKILFLFSASWLIVFLYILNSLTGISVLLLTVLAVLIYTAFMKKNKTIKIISVFSSFLILFTTATYVYYISKEYNVKNKTDFTQLDLFTASGNPYTHDTLSKQCENGHPIYININYDELKQSWNKRSSINFDSTDYKGRPIKDILLRYLSSKGFRKDKESVESLTKVDIIAIEKGTTNYLLLNKMPLEKRIYQILWEYQYYCNTGNPSGHSVMQRIEYMKAACNIIKNNFFIGVGTGDLQQEFNTYYEHSNSQLDKEWRLRAHNQYITMFVAFGIFGFLWFLFILFYPPLKMKLFNDYYFFVFFIIIALSMMNEDTLETQAGVTFFAFFYSFLLFSRQNEIQKIKN